MFSLCSDVDLLPIDVMQQTVMSLDRWLGRGSHFSCESDLVTTFRWRWFLTLTELEGSSFTVARQYANFTRFPLFYFVANILKVLICAKKIYKLM